MRSISLTLDSDSESGAPHSTTTVLSPAPIPTLSSTVPLLPDTAFSTSPVLSKSSSSTLPKTSDPPSSSTDDVLALVESAVDVDEVLQELKKSEPPFWTGDANLILENCEWAEAPVGTSSFLKWKADAPLRPHGSSPEVLVGWIGEVSHDAPNLRADGGFKIMFGEEKAAKQKRIIPLTKPTSANKALLSAWEAQYKGAKTLIESGCRTRTGRSIARGYSFLDEEMGYLKIRSAVFKPKPVPEESEDSDDDADPFYPLWDFSSPTVQAAFDRVVAKGLVPQGIEAYDEFDHLIRTNDVSKVLPGAIVCVFATLERTLFQGAKQPNGRAWQFYANLVKVQVLQRRPRPERSAPKRKQDHLPTFVAKRRQIL